MGLFPLAGEGPGISANRSRHRENPLKTASYRTAHTPRPGETEQNGSVIETASTCQNIVEAPGGWNGWT